MPQLKAEGWFDVEILPDETYLKKVGEKGTPHLVIPYRVTSGEFEGYEIVGAFPINLNYRQGGKHAGRTNRDVQADVLRSLFGFDGDWHKLMRGGFLAGQACRIVVNSEEYQGKTYYKVGAMSKGNGYGDALTEDEFTREFSQGHPAQRAQPKPTPPPRAEPRAPSDDLPF